MNIANIFGLHLGCIIRLENGKQFKADGVCYGKSSNRPMVRCNDEDLSLYIDHCKLLLKPLSGMSDEDKREFERAFGYEDKVISFEIYKEKTVLVCFEFTDFDGDPMDRWDDVSLNEILWLCSKGYDVGIVPDEYKEVVE